MDVEQLAFTVDWSALTSLQRLDLQCGSRPLPADLVRSLSSLTSLRHLRLCSGSQLLPGISCLIQLTCLSFSGSAELAELPKLSCLSQLQRLDLSGCALLAQLPANLSNLDVLDEAISEAASSSPASYSTASSFAASVQQAPQHAASVTGAPAVLLVAASWSQLCACILQSGDRALLLEIHLRWQDDLLQAMTRPCRLHQPAAPQLCTMLKLTCSRTQVLASGYCIRCCYVPTAGCQQHTQQAPCAGLPSCNALICYAQPDSAQLASAVQYELAADGLEGFLGEPSPSAAPGWPARVSQAAWTCSVFIMLLSPSFFLSHWPVLQLRVALTRKQRAQKPPAGGSTAPAIITAFVGWSRSEAEAALQQAADRDGQLQYTAADGSITQGQVLRQPAGQPGQEAAELSQQQPASLALQQVQQLLSSQRSTPQMGSQQDHELIEELMYEARLALPRRFPVPEGMRPARRMPALHPQIRCVLEHRLAGLC